MKSSFEELESEFAIRRNPESQQALVALHKKGSDLK